MTVALVVAALTPLPALGEVVGQPVLTSDTWYVNAVTGNDTTGTGTALKPWKTIGRALDTADESDTVMLAKGMVYGEASGEEFPLFVDSGVTVTSNATDPDDRPIVGAPLGSTVGGPVFVVVEADDVTIENLVVSGGQGEVLTQEGLKTAQVEAGGGIVIEMASATLSDVVVTGCSSMIGGGLFGGGAYITLEDCEFYLNGFQEGPPESPVELAELAAQEIPETAWPATMMGGAAYFVESEVYATGCTVEENMAMESGAGIAGEYSYVDWSDSSISGNVVPAWDEVPDNLGAAQFEEPAGGALMLSGGWFEFSECDFVGNSAPEGGVAYVYVHNVSVFEDCSFDHNWAEDGAVFEKEHFGGWFDLEAGLETPGIEEPEYDDALVVERSTFFGNGLVDGAFDPEQMSSDLICSDECGYNMLTNCLFAANAAFEGVYDYNYGEDGTSRYVNLTFADNLFPGPCLSNDTWDGGAAFALNCIFWGNGMPGAFPFRLDAQAARPHTHTDHDGNVVELPGLSAQEMPGDDVWNVDTFCSDSDRGIDAYSEGVIEEDPMFLDPIEWTLDFSLEAAGAGLPTLEDSGDWHLLYGSPCIDTGWEGEGDAPGDDLDGLERPVDGDFDGSEDWDMGAYEFSTEEVARLAGHDRYATAIEISQESFPGDSCEVVVIATGRTFADGLSCAGLAGYYDAPILLTPPTLLPGEVAAEIERLGASRVILVGGTNAIRTAVEADLADLDVDVDRIGGADRYETAALVAAELAALQGPPQVTFVARGDRYADALAASPVAWALNAPILLAKPGELPDNSVGVADSAGEVVIVGGSGAVSGAVEGQIRALGALVTRIDGADRYETSANFSEYAYDQRWADFGYVGMATGATFPDALAGGAGIGAQGGVLLMTPPTALHPAPQTSLEDHAGEVAVVKVLGGTNALSAAVMTAIETAITP